MVAGCGVGCARVELRRQQYLELYSPRLYLHALRLSILGRRACAFCSTSSSARPAPPRLAKSRAACRRRKPRIFCLRVRARVRVRVRAGVRARARARVRVRVGARARGRARGRGRACLLARAAHLFVLVQLSQQPPQLPGRLLVRVGVRVRVSPGRLLRRVLHRALQGAPHRTLHHASHRASHRASHACSSSATRSDASCCTAMLASAPG